MNRRDILKSTVAAAVSARIAVSRGMIWHGGAASGSVGATFDFYISTTGSDANPGTLASPWAITSLQTTSANWSKIASGTGKRIGLLPGTYNVGSMMINDPVSGALQIPGGSSGAWTYLGSSDSSGHYSPRTATITAYYNSLFGGHNSSSAGSWDGPILSHTGQYPSAYPVGYLTIDGIRFTGFNYKGVRIGGNSSGDGPVITAPVTIQNCEFFGGGFNTGDFQDNLTALWVDPFHVASGQAFLVTNCWFHDTVGYAANDMDHLTAIQIWGFSTSNQRTEVSYCTVVNAGNIYGKEGGVEGSSVHHNYLDISMFTTYAGGYQDWASGGGSFTGLTLASSFKNNILVTRGGTAGNNAGIGFPTLGQNTFGSSFGWQTPVEFSNNTIVSAAGTAGPQTIYAVAAQNESGIGQTKVFNNIYVNNGSSGSWNNFGNFMTTAKSPAVWDYNLYPSSGVQWAIVPDANNGSMCGSHTLYTTAATFSAGIAAGAGISGVESHGVAGAPTFANTGLYAALYKLAGGSAGIGQGSTDGTTGGSACDMGAWGGATVPTQIGCDFAT